MSVVVADQPFDAVSVGESEDGDLVPLQSGEDWIAQLDDDLSRPASQPGEVFSISALQYWSGSGLIPFHPGRR